MRPVDSQRYLFPMPHGPLTAYQRPNRLPPLICYQCNGETFNHTQFSEQTGQHFKFQGFSVKFLVKYACVINATNIYIFILHLHILFLQFLYFLFDLS